MRMVCLVVLGAAVVLVTMATVTGGPATQPAQGKQPDGGDIFLHNERDSATVEAARAQLPDVKVELPDHRLERLPRTVKALRDGQPLRIVMLGDSIINDTARSVWHDLLHKRYPRTEITRIISVCGGKGCQWYIEDNRIDRYVLQQQPDLVILGGISHRYNLDAVRECIRQIRAGCQADIWLMTGPYGTGVDPMQSPEWRKLLHDGADEKYAADLSKLASDEAVEYLDLQLAWGDFLRKAKRPVTDYMRDTVHANALGEAVLARILDDYFAASLPQTPAR